MTTSKKMGVTNGNGYTLEYIRKDGIYMKKSIKTIGIIAAIGIIFKEGSGYWLER